MRDHRFEVHALCTKLFHPLSTTQPLPSPSIPCNHILSPLRSDSPIQFTHFPHLANSPMNTLTHRSLPSPSLRLTSWVDARTRMLFLGAGIFALAQDREVGFIVVLFVVSLFLSSPSIFTIITNARSTYTSESESQMMRGGRKGGLQ